MLFLLLMDALGASFAAACAGCVERPSDWWDKVSPHLRQMDKSMADDAMRPTGTAPVCTCLGPPHESELPTHVMGTSVNPSMSYQQRPPQAVPTAVHAAQPIFATPAYVQQQQRQQQQPPRQAQAQQPRGPTAGEQLASAAATAAASAVVAGVSALMQPRGRQQPGPPPGGQPHGVARAQAVPVGGNPFDQPPVARGVPVVPVARPVPRAD